MRQCLTSDLGGYYTSTAPTDTDQFGTKGDFVTSPEISQVFGELVGLWVVAEWIAQGRRSEGVYLMEMGPGRGTLMDDMLRTIRNFPALAQAIEAVYMVEASPRLREAQHKLLCGDYALRENEVGYESVSKHSPSVKVIWTEDVRLVPHDPTKTPFIIAHEFFDALPIHVFQSVPPPPEDSNAPMQTPTGPIQQRRIPKENQWRELVVSPTPPHKLAPNAPEFELTVARAATPHSMYLPETSARYKALKSTAGATIEISPESQAYARDFAIRLGGGESPTSPSPSSTPGDQPTTSPTPNPPPSPKPNPSGAALIIDYGPLTTIPSSSLRGIKSHTLLPSPFTHAGQTDLSADVDFRALAETAINNSPGVEVHGPVDQARFLTAMGGEARVAQLVKKAIESVRGKVELTEVVKRVEGGWRRLVDCGEQGMGGLYQVMAIVPYTGPPREGQARRRPVGFGGDVEM